MANYGYTPAAPVNLQLPASTTTSTDLEAHVERLQELHRFAHDIVREAQAHQAEYANRQRLPVPFKPGDMVRISAQHLSFGQQPCPKFRDRFIGPCQIVKQMSPVAFKIRLPPGATCHDVFHASRLEKWTRDVTHGRQCTKPPPLIADPAAEFVVDRLLDVDFNRNLTGLLFKVRWSAPYNDEQHDSWEPLRGLQRLSALDDFLQGETWKKFIATPDYLKFQARFPKRVPAEDS